ncbi:MAG: hypothetical protein NT075_00880 [Chloroflexi bacterium]|nr:hypothetical protein [Chloroflexota bacterium]
MVLSLLLSVPVMAKAAAASQGASIVSASGDAFEEDDVCANAHNITVDAAAQAHNLFRDGGVDDADWIKFDVVQGERYEIAAKPDALHGADANLAVELYRNCDSAASTVADGKITFKAAVTGVYLVQVKNKEPNYGDQNDYALSVVKKPQPKRSIPLGDVAIEIRRRAADFVEEMRGGPLAPNWQNARFAQDVRLLYRPDLGDAPAYYEFPLEAPDGKGQFEPAGFVQVAADSFDYPISHWDFTGKSPTEEMDDLAALSSAENTQYYKLDALAYTAEYEEPAPLGEPVVQSQSVVRIGNWPTKLIGDLSTLALDGEPQVWTAKYEPKVTDDSLIDPNAPASTALVVTEPTITKTVPISETSWNSWDELKNGYASDYGVLLGALSQESKGEWGELADLAQFGEGLIAGDVRTVRALEGMTVTQITVTGPGADPEYLQQDAVAASVLAQSVRLTVLKSPTGFQVALPLTVTISYAGGASEIKRFAVISNETNSLYLPLITNGTGQQAESAAVTAPSAVHDAWGPWQYWWAGTTTDQRIYDQMTAHSSPNNTNCYSGCAATAWAMLFGWADYRASIPGSGWNGRFGIYRQNGGYGADAVAPKTMNTDVGIKNVMMETARYMGTTCTASGEGSTSSANMGQAYRYLIGRSGAQVLSKYANGWWVFGTSEDEVTNYAIDIIKSGRPAVIGREGHAPLAWGYAESSRRVRHCFIFCWYTTDYDRRFYLNQGWSGAGDGWVSAKAFFAGEIRP